jgi:hypothetical protein
LDDVQGALKVVWFSYQKRRDHLLPSGISGCNMIDVEPFSGTTFKSASLSAYGLYSSPLVHTLSYFRFYIKYPNMSASKMAEGLSRRHPLQRLQSPSRGVSAVLHVRTLTFCLHILFLRIFLYEILHRNRLSVSLAMHLRLSSEFSICTSLSLPQTYS